MDRTDTHSDTNTEAHIVGTANTADNETPASTPESESRQTEANADDCAARESTERWPQRVPRRQLSICAICRDDITANLGRRRMLFHLDEQTRDQSRDPTTEVVKQMHDMMSLFANGAAGRQCDLTHCTQTFVEAVSSKWCCRKCERMVAVVYKKYHDLLQFYNQFKDCPLSSLLNSLSVNNACDVDNDTLVSDAENTITIHGVIIEESELRIECSDVEPKNVNLPNEDISSKKRKLIDENSENVNKDSENNETNTPIENIDCIGKRKTRSRKSAESRPSPTRKTASKAKNSISKEPNNGEVMVERTESNVESECKKLTIDSDIKEAKLSSTDREILSSLYNHFYEGVLRAMFTDDKLRAIALAEVGKFVSRELLSAATEVAKMSNTIDRLKIPELKRLIQASMPSCLQLLSAIVGKDNVLNAPLISLISILVYVLNSHANMFQKMIATLLLQAKCTPATIEKLHAYKLCIAYETLVSFIDNNTQTSQVPKLIKSFQFV